MHVVTEFHSTVSYGQTVSLRLIEKNELVCLICIEGHPSSIKIKVGFYIKYYFDNYHKTTDTGKKKRNLKNFKKSKK